LPTQAGAVSIPTAETASNVAVENARRRRAAPARSIQIAEAQNAAAESAPILRADLVRSIPIAEAPANAAAESAPESNQHPPSPHTHPQDKFLPELETPFAGKKLLSVF